MTVSVNVVAPESSLLRQGQWPLAERPGRRRTDSSRGVQSVQAALGWVSSFGGPANLRRGFYGSLSVRIAMASANKRLFEEPPGKRGDAQSHEQGEDAYAQLPEIVELR